MCPVLAIIGRQLKFPAQIIRTQLRPDMIIYSDETMQVIMLELTVPWKENVDETHERNLGKFL